MFLIVTKVFVESYCFYFSLLDPGSLEGGMIVVGVRGDEVLGVDDGKAPDPKFTVPDATFAPALAPAAKQLSPTANSKSSFVMESQYLYTIITANNMNNALKNMPST